MKYFVTPLPILIKSNLGSILFYEFSDRLTLKYLSKILDIHPVHLSRDLSKYFNCNLGFADQSHFNRCFSKLMLRYSSIN